MPGALQWGWCPETEKWVKLRVDEDGSIHVVGYVDELGDIGDVTITAVADGEFISWSDGLGYWQNRLLAEADIPDAVAYSDAKALAAAIAGGLSKLVAMASTVNIVLDYNRTTTLDWTDVDLTAVCSANAKFALLQMQIRVDSISAGAGNYAYVQVRQNGTTVVDGILWVSGAHHVAGSRDYNNVIVALDAGQVFEYTIVIAGTAQVDSFISLSMYFE